MKSSGVVALVAAGVIVGGGAATYSLTRPVDRPVQVRFVDPASDVTSEPTATETATVAPTTAEPTTATATTEPAATTSTTSDPVASELSTTTKEATVSQPQQTTAEPNAATTTSAPAGSNAPRKGPNDGAPGAPAATGVFGGPDKG